VLGIVAVVVKLAERHKMFAPRALGFVAEVGDGENNTTFEPDGFVAVSFSTP
jgi:hypothetical protein